LQKNRLNGVDQLHFSRLGVATCSMTAPGGNAIMMASELGC
jgi:hypothetical protein